VIRPGAASTTERMEFSAGIPVMVIPTDANASGLVKSVPGRGMIRCLLWVIGSARSSRCGKPLSRCTFPPRTKCCSGRRDKAAQRWCASSKTSRARAGRHRADRRDSHACPHIVQKANTEEWRAALLVAPDVFARATMHTDADRGRAVQLVAARMRRRLCS